VLGRPAGCPSDGLLLGARLAGLPVVDIESATTIGRVRELVIDPRAHRVAGVVVRARRRLARGGDDLTVPAEAVHFVGTHAMTLRPFARWHQHGVELVDYPTRTALLGRRVVSWSGRIVGAVLDVLLDRWTGAIVGYVVAWRGGPPRGFGLPSARGASVMDYVRSDEGVRVGPHLVVAPDSAVVRAARLSERVEIDPLQEPPGWGPQSRGSDPVADAVVSVPRRREAAVQTNRAGA
jgi:sporulation protein YlmC with PRC-barrel domain